MCSALVNKQSAFLYVFVKWLKEKMRNVWMITDSLNQFFVTRCELVEHPVEPGNFWTSNVGWCIYSTCPAILVRVHRYKNLNGWKCHIHRAEGLTEWFDETENYVNYMLSHYITTELYTSGRFWADVLDLTLHHNQHHQMIESF